ncbi:hypothetical protein FF38_07956 [Lucilia cuprina]|uniref:Uncharacterized protein n=1 Tax=Lucilia cuprina TaxID=7375 RepID=A0A0L0C5H7_LUCCU|nr:hypothetical protein FF38_07956 [Lucilia cuprina]
MEHGGGGLPLYTSPSANFFITSSLMMIITITGDQTVGITSCICITGMRLGHGSKTYSVFESHYCRAAPFLKKKPFYCVSEAPWRRLKHHQLLIGRAKFDITKHSRGAVHADFFYPNSGWAMPGFKTALQLCPVMLHYLVINLLYLFLKPSECRNSLDFSIHHASLWDVTYHMRREYSAIRATSWLFECDSTASRFTVLSCTGHVGFLLACPSTPHYGMLCFDGAYRFDLPCIGFVGWEEPSKRYQGTLRTLGLRSTAALFPRVQAATATWQVDT